MEKRSKKNEICTRILTNLRKELAKNDIECVAFVGTTDNERNTYCYSSLYSCTAVDPIHNAPELIGKMIVTFSRQMKYPTEKILEEVIAAVHEEKAVEPLWFDGDPVFRGSVIV